MVTRVYGTVRRIRGSEEVDLMFHYVEIPGEMWSPEFTAVWLRLMDEAYGDPFGWKRHFNDLVMFVRQAA